MSEEKKTSPPLEEGGEKKNRFVGQVDNNLSTNKSDSLEFSGKDDVRSLLEKNLKWSQIIYEQNRKIRRHLMWSSIAGWFRIIFIIAPLLIAGWYFYPMYKNSQSQLFNLLTSNPDSLTTTTAVSGLEEALKLLNVSPAQIEQIKALKK
jgi:hypothetical protein